MPVKHIPDNASCCPEHIGVITEVVGMSMDAVAGMIVIIGMLRMYTW